MFGKKYTPSVKNNMQLKEKVVNEISSFIYRLERGRVDSEAERDELVKITQGLKEHVVTLNNTVGTGEENIESSANKIFALLKDLKKVSAQETVGRFNDVVEELDFHVVMLKDVFEGEIAISSDEDEKAFKLSYTRRKLNERLEELREIKDAFTSNSRRIEKEIQALERDLEELNQSIVKEDNERKINELFKRINSIKANIDSLSVRKEGYLSCFTLLNAIYSNAKEIVLASDFAVDEIGKAKALLDISKLKKVITAPDKALIILKRMQTDIKEIKDRSQIIDSRIAELNTSSTTVNQDAMAYKAELMRKQREKAGHSDFEATVSSSTTINTETTTEEEN